MFHIKAWLVEKGAALFTVCSLLTVGAISVYGQDYAYQATPIQEVIQDIQETTAYRFLYRDALISGKTVSFTANADALLARLDDALANHQIAMRVDAQRYQVLLSEDAAAPEATTDPFFGHLLDAQTGERLPFGTITWNQAGQLQGVVANEAGAFRIPKTAYLAELDGVMLTASYVGYHPQQVWLPTKVAPQELAIRLQSHAGFTQEVLISSTVLHTDLDTTWHHLIQPSQYTPLGEGSPLRALQTLPSVSLTPAFSGGLNVRGSKADGFQILLDEIPIYSQHHLFGLFDPFNQSALQTVGFFYDVAPASFQAPPGGTLSFLTRTGSQAHTQQRLETSNTAVNGTLEGPLLGGAGSWLLSGRHSYLNQVDWFNNKQLIEMGLDINRENSLPANIPQAHPRFENFGDARFYDLHGKLYWESARGHRWMLSGYLGGDVTTHEKENVLATRRGDADNVDYTFNRWFNNAGSLQYQRLIGATGYLRSVLAFSVYTSRFRKDDYTYIYVNDVRQANDNAQPATFVGLFKQGNRLRDWKWAQHLDLTLPTGTLALGYTLHHYDMEYGENSARVNIFKETQNSIQADVFGEYNVQIERDFRLQLGARSHYFSNGKFLRLSPRIKARFGPEEKLSFGVGYSQNYQFLHRLYLENVASADVWILSTEGQPPSSVNNLTAGIYLKASANTFLQIEAYAKTYENVRQHETVVLRRQRVPTSVLFAPWFSDTNGRARGIEVMWRQRFGPVLWTNSYTLSKAELQHARLNAAEYYPAEWDRRHQFSTHLSANLTKGLNANITWFYATGNPNTLASPQQPSEPEYLADYHRLDVGLRYTHTFPWGALDVRGSIFNVYNRKNVWYRNAIPVLLLNTPTGQRDFPIADVYDLGFQPSFSFSLIF